MHSFGCGGYVNTNSDDSSVEGSSVPNTQMQLMARLYGSNAHRLLEIKRVYDPDNFFHHNSNIKGDDCPAVCFSVLQE